MTLDPPPLRDDCFALPAGVEWTPVDVALAHLRDGLHCVAGVESVDIEEASGRILAQPVTALRAHPPLANAAVDGYGFAHDALGTSPYELPLGVGRAAAGAPFAGAVPAGHAIRVLTGAPLPAGVDTVVLEEDCAIAASAIAFRGPVRAGANARAAGEDCTVGQALLPAGHVMQPGDLALLAATGHGQVPVRKRLRVGVLSTGDELAKPGAALRADQIPDANGPMLRALVRGWGLEAVDLGRAPDDRAALRGMLDAAAARCDAILTSGGASAGDEDHLSALLQAEGRQTLWRIAMKPGRPLALGLWQGCPLFGLPGNPVAAWVTAVILARPALGVLAGRGWRPAVGRLVPAGFEKTRKPGRRDFLRAREREGRIEVFQSEGSGRISGLSWAEGLVDLPADGAPVRSGEPVRYLPWTELQTL